MAKIGVGANQAARVGVGVDPVNEDELKFEHSKLSKDLMHIDIKIGDFKLRQNMKDVLYFGEGCGSLDTLTDADLSQALFLSSEFRVTVGVAIAHLMWHLESLERAIFRFESKQMIAARDRLIEQRKEWRGGKVTEATLVTSKEEKMSEMLEDEEIAAMWEDSKEEIADCKRDLSILKSLDKSLEERTMVLQGIAKRKFIERADPYSLKKYEQH